MPAFLIHGEIDPEGRFEIRSEDVFHLTKVLRVREGQNFEVLLPGGGKGWAVLKRRGSRYVGKLKILLPVQAAPPLPLWLGMGMIRWARMEWLMEKATELGLHRLSPVKLQRGRLPKGESVSPQKMKRLHKIAEETQKQCERIGGPRIDDPMSLGDFLELQRRESKGNGQRLLFRERIPEPPFFRALNPKAESFVFLVGPEGGWSLEERRLAQVGGFEEVSLGETPLRSETAALYGIAALHFFLTQHRRSK